MKQSEVKIYGEYQITHHGDRYTPVRVLYKIKTGGYGNSFYKTRETTHYRCLNLSTGREIEVKSAAKLQPLGPTATKRILFQYAIAPYREVNKEVMP